MFGTAEYNPKFLYVGLSLSNAFKKATLEKNPKAT